MYEIESVRRFAGSPLSDNFHDESTIFNFRHAGNRIFRFPPCRKLLTITNDEDTTVTVTVDRTYPGTLHPLHTLLLAGAVPLFLGALLSDLAYSSSYQIQWANFASWLIAGALLLTGLALLCAIARWLRTRSHYRNAFIYPLLLLVTWVLGFINALIHAKDAYAIMPTSLTLSIIVAVLICVTAWIGLTSYRAGGAK